MHLAGSWRQVIEGNLRILSDGSLKPKCTKGAWAWMPGCQTEQLGLQIVACGARDPNVSAGDSLEETVAVLEAGRLGQALHWPRRF